MIQLLIVGAHVDVRSSRVSFLVEQFRTTRKCYRDEQSFVTGTTVSFVPAIPGRLHESHGSPRTAISVYNIYVYGAVHI
jgi:hypothetical protein